MIGAMEFGIMCRESMRVVEAPIARAASTYSFFLMPRMELRKTRAMLGHPMTPIAMNTFWKPLPKTAINVTAKRIYGKAKKTSAVRIIKLSHTPP